MTSLDTKNNKSSSLDSKGDILLEDEDKIYKSLDGPTGGGLGSAAIHKNQSNTSFNMSMGASMDFGDSFAVADDDDDLADLCADAAQFQKLDSDKPKNKPQQVRTASRQPAFDLILEHDEDEEEEEDN